MVALPDMPAQLTSALQRAKRLRVLAEDCRSMARIIQNSPDQERMLAMAQHHDAEADQLEAIAASVG
jgi:hypothetical protein